MLIFELETLNSVHWYTLALALRHIKNNAPVVHTARAVHVQIFEPYVIHKRIGRAGRPHQLVHVHLTWQAGSHQELVSAFGVADAKGCKVHVPDEGKLSMRRILRVCEFLS